MISTGERDVGADSYATKGGGDTTPVQRVMMVFDSRGGGSHEE